jgi:predicted DNA-binding transcriptional regulator YafY
MGVPILGQSGPNGGYEIDRDSTLSPLHLTWREALLLMLAVDALSKMSDTPFLADRASLRAKLHALLPPSQSERVAVLLERVGLEVPARPQRTPLLDRLLELCGSWVQVDYAGKLRTVRIDRLYADRGFWYIVGLCDGRSKVFRADRIVDVAPCATPPETAEPLPYGHPSHPRIEVELTPAGARRAQSDPHLGPHVTGPGHLAFHCPPEELDWHARYFIGFGEEATVLAPPELVAEIGRLAHRLAERYPCAQSFGLSTHRSNE